MNKEDVMEELGVSASLASKIIAELNRELREKGYLTIRGRIARAYLYARYK